MRKPLVATACIVVSLVGTVIIANGVYEVRHPKPHPHEWEAFGAAVFAILFGWPMACVGLSAAVGAMRGVFWRGIAWGAAIAVTPILIAVISKPILVWLSR